MCADALVCAHVRVQVLVLERVQSMSWTQTIGFIASEPARVAIVVAVAQNGRAIEEVVLAQHSSLLYQRIAGRPVETAVLLKHIRDLAEAGVIQRDESGFRWQFTALGQLASRQWAGASLEPVGNAALSQDEVRGWRDRLIDDMQTDAGMAESAGLSMEELLAGQAQRLAELRVLNRVLGEDELPAWLRQMAPSEE